MTIVFFGSSAYGLPTLRRLKDHPTSSVCAVVVPPDKPQGRHLEVKNSPVKDWALSNDVECLTYTPKDLGSCFARVKALNADLFVVASFGFLLNSEWLALPRIAPVNIHASLLPKYRGASPMQSALLHGDHVTGVTLMRMVKGLDEGDVLLKKQITIDPRETIRTLEVRLAELGALALEEALPILQGSTASWIGQDHAKATVCKKIRKDDGRLDWKKSASILDREIRAYLGWPGSFAFIRGKRLVIHDAEVRALAGGLVPGRVRAADPGGLLIEAGENGLLLKRVQLEGRKEMNCKDFLLGAGIKAGSFLE